MPDRRWFVHRTNSEYIQYLSKTASISPAFAQILINRGIKSAEKALTFLDSSIDKLPDPFKLQGIKEASEYIRSAIKEGKRFLVHGDYDADGLTGTAIMVSTLMRLGADVHYFIPEKLVHGYGFNPPGVKFAQEIGADLIVTVDCGITSHEAVALAKTAGIGVIITDHHEPQRDDLNNPLLPQALAIVNPRLTDLDAPVISGSAVAFKLSSALIGFESSYDLIDLVTIGTIADVIPLIEENRIIVKEGMRLLNDGVRSGIRALKDVSRLNNRTISAGLLSFTIIPRLNASGRIDNARNVVKLLLSDNYEESLSIAQKLNEFNQKRQAIEDEIYLESLSELDKKGYDLSILLASEGWHEGVIGIVASRLAEVYYRPVFVFNIKNGIARGSARSIPPFDLYNSILRCKDLLLSFGGHRKAAGLSLRVENLKEFERRMNSVVSEVLSEEDLIPTLTIDATVALRDINFGLVQEIARLEPLGYGNPEPLIGTKGIEVITPRVVGKNHLKMKLKHRTHILEAIGFNMGDLMKRLEISTAVDAVYTPKINEWEGGKTLQAQLRAFRPAI